MHGIVRALRNGPLLKISGFFKSCEILVDFLNPVKYLARRL